MSWTRNRCRGSRPPSRLGSPAGNRRELGVVRSRPQERSRRRGNCPSSRKGATKSCPGRGTWGLLGFPPGPHGDLGRPRVRRPPDRRARFESRAGDPLAVQGALCAARNRSYGRTRRDCRSRRLQAQRPRYRRTRPRNPRVSRSTRAATSRSPPYRRSGRAIARPRLCLKPALDARLRCRIAKSRTLQYHIGRRRGRAPGGSVMRARPAEAGILRSLQCLCALQFGTPACAGGMREVPFRTSGR